MYLFVFDEDVIKFLQKQPKEVRSRIYNKIISTNENPFHFFERLTNRKDFKLRVGDFRVIADIDSSIHQIHITYIEHRSKVYK